MGVTQFTFRKLNRGNLFGLRQLISFKTAPWKVSKPTRKLHFKGNTVLLRIDMPDPSGRLDSEQCAVKVIDLIHETLGFKVKPVSILFVTNNQTLSDFVAEFLQDYYREEAAVVGTVCRGKEALAYAKKLWPEIILLDLAIPDLPALEVIPLLQAAAPQVIVVVLVAYNVWAYRAAALTAGADEVIFKGRLAADLLPALQRLTEVAQSAGSINPIKLPLDRRSIKKGE